MEGTNKMKSHEGDRSKLAGEVTEGDRAMAVELIEAANGDGVDCQWMLPIIAKHRAAAVAEAVAERDADIALATSTIVKCKAWIDEAKPLLEKGGQAESKVAALEAENKRLVAAVERIIELYRIEYIIGQEDGGRVESAMKQAQAALQPAPKV